MQFRQAVSSLIVRGIQVLKHRDPTNQANLMKEVNMARSIIAHTEHIFQVLIKRIAHKSGTP